MTSEQPTNQFPWIEDCIELYQHAYERHGTTRFTAEHLDCERDRILEMAVAYGLLSWDGVSYCVSVAPTDSTQSWHTLFRQRADRVSEKVSEEGLGAEQRRTESDTAETVFISDSDDLGTVIESFHSFSLCEGDEVILRSAGEQANTAQRIADQLCDPSGTDDCLNDFQKEFTDVVGDNKDDLEFRVCLRLVS